MSLLGQTLGRLRIVDVLGQGGMGQVYLGFDEVLKRKVALKAIRDEQRLDADAKARFLREARILSQLDHPNICRIHELIEGEDEDFLVLELISGTSLRKAFEGDLDEKLRLYVAEMVAEALVAAHAKGIAHRDLKPENIMLTTEGEVKVLDFGLAFPVDERLAASMTLAGEAVDRGVASPGTDSREITATVVAPLREDHAPPREEHPAPLLTPTLPAPSAEATFLASVAAESSPELSSFLETQTGTVMGTVAYMSPEQTRGERVSVASDLYSFGLILQELFTGCSAYGTGLKFAPLLLKAAEGDTLPMTGVDPELAELVTRMKSLAPEARPTAVEVAERLRAIRDKPKRRRRRLAAAALVVIALLGGLKYTLDLRAERRAANEARIEAEEVSDFLLELFAVSDPAAARGRDVTAREMLATGAARINALESQPLVQSRLLFTMGRAYRRLGLYAEAEPLLAEALLIRRQIHGNRHPEIPIYLDQLASLYLDTRRLEAAEPLLLEALRLGEAVLAPGDPDLAAISSNLASLHAARGDDERAEALYLRAVEIHESVGDAGRADLATGLNNLGDFYRDRGDGDRAVTYLRRAVELQESLADVDLPGFAASLNNLALVHLERGETEAAEPLFHRALEMLEESLGEEHPDVARLLANLAELHHLAGDNAAAEPLVRRALEIQERAFGPEHPGLVVLEAGLADLLLAQNRENEAAALLMRALARTETARTKVEELLATGSLSPELQKLGRRHGWL